MPYRLPEDKDWNVPHRYTHDEWNEKLDRVLSNNWVSWDEFQTRENTPADQTDFKYPDEPLLTVNYSLCGRYVEWWTKSYVGTLSSVIELGHAGGNDYEEQQIEITLLRRNPTTGITM